METPPLADSRKLTYRLKRIIEKHQKISFLLGSGLTLPVGGSPGVPSATNIVHLIKDRFVDDEGRAIFAENVPNAEGAAAYQSAMKVLVECEGQPALNEVIAEAVLKSYIDAIPSDNITSTHFEDLEKNMGSWALNDAVRSLAAIYVKYPKEVGPILTSNFDPLIEIAIRKAGGVIDVIPISEDGVLLGFETETSHRRVVHFHGYWRGVDTLHTTEQITRSRPKLAADLRRLLSNTALVVLGYGGWDDVFMKTLCTIVSEGSATCDILWGFHEDTDEEIYKRYAPMLDQLRPQIGGRVNLYRGIDLNTLLPNLAAELKANAISKNSSAVPIKVLNSSSEKLSARQNTFEKDPGCGPLPSAEYWTGRSSEMLALSSQNYKAAILTGIGGQGKSCLASAFLIQKRGDTSAVFWDWRDCREERNHMHTNLVNICIRLSRGLLSSDDLKDETEQSLVETLFNSLGNREAIFVFDNVDEYIDLKDLVPMGAVKIIIDEALIRQHRAIFLFTCRPQVSLIGTNLLQLPITGLSEDECYELFVKYQTQLPDETIKNLSTKASNLTGGHPFWISIIAAQAANGADDAISFMDEIIYGDVSISLSASEILAEKTLSVVWRRLTEKNRTLLKAMAEAVCEESKDQLVDILSKELNYNAISKSLKKLRQLNLVVTKSSNTVTDYFDLHPLVRTFIRARFSPDQRNKWIVLFINYFERIIGGLRTRIGPRSTLSDFRNWSYKIELETNCGRFSNALEALQEVSSKLESAGFVEEYIRISELVLSRMDWINSFSKNYKFLDIQVCRLVEALSELGRFDEADKYLNSLKSCVNGSGISYLRMCDAATKRFWDEDEFDQAIEYGREAIRLKKSGADVNVDVEHHLALALRDTRQKKLIEEALDIFLQGNKLKDVIDDSGNIDRRSMAFFGNIGRCLQFLGKLEEAMECYSKSVQCQDEDEDVRSLGNRAYACRWIAEIFEAQEQYVLAAHFFKYAENLWLTISPPRSRKMQEAIDRLLLLFPEISSTAQKSEMEIRSFCENRMLSLVNSQL